MVEKEVPSGVAILFSIDCVKGLQFQENYKNYKKIGKLQVFDFESEPTTIPSCRVVLGDLCRWDSGTAATTFSR